MVKQQQNRQKDNYFKQQIKRFGPNFLDFKKSKDFNNYDCKRIFNDLASGNIDINTEAVYLTDPRISEPCISIARSKVFYYQTIVMGMEMLIANYNSMYGIIPENTYAVYNHVTNALKAWQLIENAFNYFKVSPDYKSVVITLISNLKPLRGNI